MDLEQKDLERSQRGSLSGFGYTFLVKKEEYLDDKLIREEICDQYILTMIESLTLLACCCVFCTLVCGS